MQGEAEERQARMKQEAEEHETRIKVLAKKRQMKLQMLLLFIVLCEIKKSETKEIEDIFIHLLQHCL